MPVDYSQFIEEAEKSLGQQSVPEIACRSSISRAYYGAYHVALEYADSISVPPVSDTGGSSHRKLSAYYEGNMDSDKDFRLKFRRVGYALKQLHDSRVRADYKLELLVSFEDASAHLIRCNSLVEQVCNLKALKAA